MPPVHLLRALRRFLSVASAMALFAAVMPASAVNAEPAWAVGPDPAAKAAAAARVAADLRSDRAAGLIVTYARPLARSSAAMQAAGEAAEDESDSDVAATVAVDMDTSAIRFDEATTVEEAQRAADEVARLPGVASAVPDRYRTIKAASPVVPNDTFWDAQWSLWDSRDVADGEALPPGGYGTHSPALWRATRGSASTVVAVLDTGRTSHPELDGNTVAGYDMVSDGGADGARDGNGRDADPSDQGDWSTAGQCGLDEAYASSWHGTHVAGIIAAAAGNGAGVAGNAPRVSVQHVRVLGTCGGADSDILAAITWASGGVVPGLPVNRTPAKVINLSFGAQEDVCPAEWATAIEAARSRGSVVVAAAGNDNSFAGLTTPANCPGVVTVAATEEYGQRASYSNRGSAVELSAPGGDSGPGYHGILSTVNVGTTVPTSPTYAEYEGTSMAAPAVSAAAALVASLGTTSPDAIEGTLLHAVQPFPKYGGDLARWDCTQALCGAGILDLARVPARTSTPVVHGTPRPGATLRATAGTWVGSPSAFRYQWLRSGRPVTNATSASYKVGPADAGSRLAVRVTAVKGGFSPPPVTSAQSAVVPKVTSSAALAVSPKRARYGRTRATLKATVRVSAGTAVGTVVFRDGSKVLRRVTVKAGRASYRLGKRSLKRGRHKVTATFVPAGPRYAGDRSPVVVLRVR